MTKPGREQGAPPRITGGELRGRVVNVPQTGQVRPMLARARQALFNVLGNELQGPVWDCFAGSGLLAFEAVSRGASQAVLIEKDPAHFRTIRQTIESLSLADKCRLVPGSAFSAISARMSSRDTPALLVFLDPPHAMAVADDSEFWEWLKGLSQTALIDSATVVAFGHPARLSLADRDLGALKVRQTRNYGTVAFSLLAL